MGEEHRMHTVELLEHGLATARQLGYGIRHEWLGGNGGGACLLKGEKWIFLDLAQTPLEQLDQVTAAIRGEAGLDQVDVEPALRPYLLVRKSA
jgi:hypothetical protein